MKYKGKKVEGRNSEIIPFKRPDGDIIFIAEAVQDWDEFEKYCAEPEAPEILKPGGKRFKDENDPKYKKKLEEYAETRTHWLVLKSLQATKDIEWETVDMNDSNTWKNYRKELKDSGFTELELGRLVRGVMVANSLDEDMIETAKQDFLRGREANEK